METILIIEDDAALASGLCRALTSEDRTLQSCGKIREARRLLREAQPDLVILDVNLPDGSGFDFLGEIKGKGDGSGHPSYSQRHGDRHRGGAGGGSRRLHHQALQPGCAAGPGQYAAEAEKGDGKPAGGPVGIRQIPVPL